MEYRPAARVLGLQLVCGATIPTNKRDPCIRGTTTYRLDLSPGAAAPAATG
jgi:hypothetical protein